MRGRKAAESVGKSRSRMLILLLLSMLLLEVGKVLLRVESGRGWRAEGGWRLRLRRLMLIEALRMVLTQRSGLRPVSELRLCA